MPLSIKRRDHRPRVDGALRQCPRRHPVMTITVDRDMERAFAQLYEIQKHLLNGSLSPLAARRPLQDLIEGKTGQDTRFDRYNHLLLSLPDQLECLRRYNEQYWDNRLTNEQ